MKNFYVQILSLSIFLLVACQAPISSTAPSPQSSLKPENYYFLPPNPSSSPNLVTTPLTSKPSLIPKTISPIIDKLISLRFSEGPFVLNRSGENITLYVIAKGQSGKFLNSSQLKLKWSVNNPEIFEIDQSGKLTAKKDTGSALVRVEDLESQLFVTVEVTIKGSGLSSGGGSGSGFVGGGSIPILPPNSNCISNCPVSSVAAGSGQAGTGGDRGPATEAQFDEPHGVALDTLGNLFIADSFNHRVRKVATDGIINTVAGLGLAGLSAEQGQATFVRINFPYSAVVKDNFLYFSEKVNNRIRRVNLSTNELMTIAGGGTKGDNEPAIESTLSFPLGIALSQDKLFIADSLHHRIRQVDLQTGLITTIAGSVGFGSSGDGGQATDARLDNPHDIAVDSQNNLFIADTLNHKIRKVNLQTGVISTYAGTGQAGNSGDGGRADQAMLDSPRGIAVDASGHLYIADTNNKIIRMVHAQTGIITRIAGGGTRIAGPALETQFEAPYDLSLDNQGNIYVVDALDNRIKKISISQ